MGYILNILENKSHPIWVFIQQFAIRGLLALKFLLIARLLGPNEVGIITVALVSLTLSEALTELGLMHAIVQIKHNEKKYSVIWSFQFLRGVTITIAMLLLNQFLVYLFKEPDAQPLIFMVAFLPLIKNAISVDYYFQIRQKNFRDVSIIFTLSSFLDLLISVILIIALKNPIFAIVSMMFAELLKVILSHICFKCTIAFDLRFNTIKDIVSYGKWIWANSVSSFLNNQFDKLIASTFLGTVSLGLYQMSQKLTQLTLTDLSFAAGQYLFPLFSNLNRDIGSHTNLKKYYSNVMLLGICISTIISCFVVIFSKEIILIILGDKWLEISGIMKVMMISSSLAAIANISVIYNRAIGKPKKVTIASYIQLGIFIFLCLVLIKPLKEYGLVMSSIISYGILILILNINFKNKLHYIRSSLKENYNLIYLCGITLMIMIITKKYLLFSQFAFILNLFMLIVLILYFGFKFRKWGEI